MKTMLAAGIGGAVGSILRYGISLVLNGAFPVGTLAVNLLGALFLGGFYTWVESHESFPVSMKAFVATGILGSLTTFSTFSFEVVDFVRGGHVLFAVMYVIVSLVSGLLFAVIGIKAGEKWWGHGLD